jgi:hypothetical protein
MKILKLLVKYKLLLFFLVILGFRFFYASNVINFTQDQARDVWKMEEFRNEGKIFIDYGPKASVGNFYLAPFYYQLQYSLSFLTNNNPLTMHLFITFVESLTPVVLFLILKKFIEKKNAYLVSLLYAVSPLVTIFASFAWNPNMIPFLSLSALLVSIKYFETKRYWYIPIFSLLLVIAVHFHYQAVVLFPFYLFVLVKSVMEDKKVIKYWLIGWFLALLTMIPYLVAELRVNWQNTSQIINYFTGEHSRYYDRVSKPAFVLTFIPEFFERVLIGKNYVLDKIIIGRFVFMIGLIFFVWRSLKNIIIGKGKKEILLLAYFFGILLMLRVYKGDKLDYYMSTLFVFPYFLLAFLLEKFKYLLAPFIIFLAFMIGQQYQTIIPKNQLKDLQYAVSFINDNVDGKIVNLHFHDDNYINIFAYGLNRYSDIKHSNQSKHIVDICYGKKQQCSGDGALWCNYDRGYTHMVLFNEQAHYQLSKLNQRNDGYNLAIGRVELIPEINYQVSTYESEYGDDFLMEVN